VKGRRLRFLSLEPGSEAGRYTKLADREHLLWITSRERLKRDREKEEENAFQE
jgi:hypothetical protein